MLDPQLIERLENAQAALHEAHDWSVDGDAWNAQTNIENAQGMIGEALTIVRQTRQTVVRMAELIGS